MIHVIATEGDSSCEVRMRDLCGRDVEIALVDRFGGDEAFHVASIPCTTAIKVLGGDTVVTQTGAAWMNLTPAGSRVRVTFQLPDWPTPQQWTVSRSQYSQSVLALL